MANSAFNQSLSMLTTGCHSDFFSGIRTSYSCPLKLYSSYIIATSLSSLSSVLVLIIRSLNTIGVDLLSHVTGLKIRSEGWNTRQSAENKYYWNETIVKVQ